MTTKVIREVFDYSKKEELPKLSLDKAIETLRTNEEVQAKLKNMVCFALNVEGGEQACTVKMKFINKEVAEASNPEEQFYRALIALAKTITKGLEGAAKKEESHD